MCSAKGVGPLASRAGPLTQWTTMKQGQALCLPAKLLCNHRYVALQRKQRHGMMLK